MVKRFVEEAENSVSCITFKNINAIWVIESCTKYTTVVVFSSPLWVLSENLLSTKGWFQISGFLVTLFTQTMKKSQIGKPFCYFLTYDSHSINF